MAYTITDDSGTTDIGNVQDREIGGNGTMLNVPVPDQDPSDTYLIPIVGTMNVINITGTYTGTATQLKDFENKLIDWKINAYKLSESDLTYYDHILERNFFGRITNASSRRSTDSANLLSYTIEFTEGTFG